jgi:hypothetical protein
VNNLKLVNACVYFFSLLPQRLYYTMKLIYDCLAPGADADDRIVLGVEQLRTPKGRYIRAD